MEGVGGSASSSSSCDDSDSTEELQESRLSCLAVPGRARRPVRRVAVVAAKPSEQSWAAYAVGLIEALRECGGGYFLRGWRRELDPDASFEFRYRQLKEVHNRLRIPGDPRTMFVARHGVGDGQIIKLRDLRPEAVELVERFRKWMTRMFLSTDKMFEAFDSDGDCYVNEEEFLDGCRETGFEGTDHEIGELFGFCDVGGYGEIQLDDAKFLSAAPPRVVADQEASRSLKRTKSIGCRTEVPDAVSWQAARQESLLLPPLHRLAHRPWLDVEMERCVPSVKRHKREAWMQKVQRRGAETRAAFVQHLLRLHGNEVRAWRVAIDVDTNFKVQPAVLRQYCSVQELKLDAASLCKSLDQDTNGFVDFSEFSPLAAADLCRLQKWSRRKFGSCAQLWDAALEARRACKGTAFCSQKKMLIGAFDAFLCESGWPSSTARLLPALDLYGCGFLQRADLEWLDKWEVPPWFDAEADPKAWKEIKRRLLRAHQHPLRVWRFLLSRDDSDTISWQEFNQACKTVSPNSNIVGAWRHLDADCSGAITLAEFDRAVAATLQSFKNWSDYNFGSVEAALTAIDLDGNQLVTYYELRSACRKLKWEGSIRQLFKCLAVGTSEQDAGTQIPGGGSRKTVSLRALRFLDRWSVVTSSPVTADDHWIASGEDDMSPTSSEASPQAAPRRLSRLAALQQSAPTLPAGSPPAPRRDSFCFVAPPRPVDLRERIADSGRLPAMAAKTMSTQQMRKTLLLPKAVANTRRQRLQLCSLPPMRTSKAALMGPGTVLVGM